MTMLATLSLVAVVGVGATFAYFTDNTSVTNVVTMGKVDVDLTEPGFDKEDGNKDNHISDIMPGQVIVKDPTITLAEDSMDAYIRVKLKVNGFEKYGQEKEAELIKDIIGGLDIDTEAWKLVGDYYYYKEALTNKVQGKNIAVLFNNVKIPADWNNDLAEVTFAIDVQVEAVQADNLEDGFIKDDGSWNIGADKIIAYK